MGSSKASRRLFSGYCRVRFRCCSGVDPLLATREELCASDALLYAKKGSALLRICLILGILLVLAGAGYGIFALTGSQEQSQGLEQLPFTADTNYVFTGSGFLYMYGDRLTYDDLLDAKKDASYQVSTGSVQLAASPTLSVLYHDTAVQILGAAESLTFTQQVEQVACGGKPRGGAAAGGRPGHVPAGV